MRIRLYRDSLKRDHALELVVRYLFSRSDELDVPVTEVYHLLGVKLGKGEALGGAIDVSFGEESSE